VDDGRHTANVISDLLSRRLSNALAGGTRKTTSRTYTELMPHIITKF